MEKKEIPHILVVDDEPDVEALFRQKFRKKIRKGELSFEFAKDGEEGLQLLKQHPDIELIFTDLNMPRMNGLQFLEAIRMIEGRVLRAVVISAYGDMNNIRQAMNQGALDFIIKPINLQDLEVTLEKGLAEVAAISAGHKARAELEATQREKEVAERSKALQKEFFDNVTHELRTPLTLLLGPLGNALQRSKDSEVLRQLHLAERNGQHLLRLIDELLLVAKIDVSALSISPVQADILNFLFSVYESFLPLAEARQVGLSFDNYDLESDFWMDFDPGKMRKVVVNLLSNALKFTPKGKTVALSAFWSEVEFGFTVMNEGAGIPPEDLPHIFDRFYRAGAGDPSIPGDRNWVGSGA